MTCAETKAMMPLYEAGELDAATMVAFESHLQKCAACNEEAQRQSATDALLREAFAREEFDASALRARVRERIYPKRTARRFMNLRFAKVAALLLLVFGGLLFYLTLNRADETVYADAADDHVQEVVRKRPLKGWRESPDEIEALAAAQLGDAKAVRRLEFSGFRLTRARVCKLAGERYLHLVYRNEGREFSVYLRRNNSELPGAVNETANGCDLRLKSENGFEVAGFQTASLTALIVSDLQRAENLQLAREAATRL